MRVFLNNLLGSRFKPWRGDSTSIRLKLLARAIFRIQWSSPRFYWDFLNRWAEFFPSLFLRTWRSSLSSRKPSPTSSLKMVPSGWRLSLATTSYPRAAVREGCAAFIDARVLQVWYVGPLCMAMQREEGDAKGQEEEEASTEEGSGCVFRQSWGCVRVPLTHFSSRTTQYSLKLIQRTTQLLLAFVNLLFLAHLSITLRLFPTDL
jgi:hypothetical protein